MYIRGKTKPLSVLEKLFTLRAWEKREENKEKGERSRIHQECQDRRVEFVGGVSLLRYVRSFDFRLVQTHISLFNSANFE